MEKLLDTIRFKGIKAEDEKEFVVGFLFQTMTDSYIAYADQYNDDLFLSPQNIFIKVLPETVGQFTGVSDVNKKDIYAGDIIEGTDRKQYVVKWNSESACFVGVSPDGICYLNEDDFLLIGNIYLK